MASFIAAVILALVIVLSIGLLSIVADTLWRNRCGQRHKGHQRLVQRLDTRSKVELFLASSPLGIWIDILQALFSVLSVVMYVWGTYLDSMNESPLWYDVIDLILTLFFTAFWSMELFLAKDRVRQLFSFNSIVDILTIIPTWFGIVYGAFFDQLAQARFLRILRVIRILRVQRILHFIRSEITRYNVFVSANVFSFLFIVAGFYMEIETNNQDGGRPLYFHESLYLIVVTLSTCGYGDFHPTTAFGEITITLAIYIGAIVLIPYQVSRLIDVYKMYSPFREGLRFSMQSRSHVVLCGDVSHVGLMEFLFEFFHESHGLANKTDVVILSPEEPNAEIVSLIRNPFYKERVTYVKGSPLIDEDLKLAEVSTAEAVFILSPRHWEAGDSKTLLTNLAIRSCAPNAKVFLKIINSDSKDKLFSDNIKACFSVQDIRMAVLANSALTPGFSTLFSNMFAARTPAPHERVDLWSTEYCYGAMHSPYRLPVPSILDGKTFAEVASNIYFGTYCLVIGLELSEDELYNKSLPSRDRVLLFPGPNYVLQAGTTLLVLASNPSMLDPIVRSSLQDPSNSQSQFSAELLRQLSEEESKATLLGSIKNVLFGKTAVVHAPPPPLLPIVDQEQALSPIKKDNHHHRHKNKNGSAYAELDEEDETVTVLPVSKPQPQPQQKEKEKEKEAEIKVSIPAVLQAQKEKQKQPEAVASSSSSSSSSAQPSLATLCTDHFDGRWDSLLSKILSLSSNKTPAAVASRTLSAATEALNRLSSDQILNAIAPLSQQQRSYIHRSSSLSSMKSSDSLSSLKNASSGISKALPPPPQDLRDHFVVCSPTTKHSLGSFFAPLKQAGESSKMMDVVLLTPEELSAAEVREMDEIMNTCHWISIYAATGSPLKHSDLIRCNAEAAARVILLSNPFTSEREDEYATDIEAIVSFHNAQKEADSSHLLLDLVHESNIRFIQKTRSFKTLSVKQAVMLSNQTNSSPVASSIRAHYWLVPEFASGCVTSFSVLDAMLCKCFFQDSLFEIANSFLFSVGPSRLRRIPIPAAFDGETYGELFKFLLNIGCLPLGLYRSAEDRQAPAPYVFTNPGDRTPLSSNDEIFVLNAPIMA